MLERARAASPGYRNVPRATSPEYKKVPRATSPGNKKVPWAGSPWFPGLAALGTFLFQGW